MRPGQPERAEPGRGQGGVRGHPLVLLRQGQQELPGQQDGSQQEVVRREGDSLVTKESSLRPASGPDLKDTNI